MGNEIPSSNPIQHHDFLVSVLLVNRVNQPSVPPKFHDHIPVLLDRRPILGINRPPADQGKTDIANLHHLSVVLQMLEAGVLGGGGSRGSGQIAIEKPMATVKRLNDYQRIASGEHIEAQTFTEKSIGELIVKVQEALTTSH